MVPIFIALGMFEEVEPPVPAVVFVRPPEDRIASPPPSRYADRIATS